MLHIELTRQADAVIVYPASANIIARFANGIADDFASSTLLASNKQIFMAPAMNTEMWNNIINTGNIEKLKKYGVVFFRTNLWELGMWRSWKRKDFSD